MKPINISSLIKKYGASYVAKNRKTGRVIAYAKRLDLLFQKTKKRADLVISWVPKSGARYAWSYAINSSLDCHSRESGNPYKLLLSINLSDTDVCYRLNMCHPSYINSD